MQAVNNAIEDQNVLASVRNRIGQEFGSNEELSEMVQWKLATVFAERRDIEYLLQRASETFPLTRITQRNVASYNEILLPLVIEGLRPVETGR